MPYLELRVCSKSERPLCFCLSLISGGEDQGAGVARRRSHGDRNVHSRPEDSGRSWEHSSSHRTGEEGTAREAGWLFKNSFHFSFPQALILLCTRHTLLSVLVVVVWDLLNDLSISVSDCVCVFDVTSFSIESPGYVGTRKSIGCRAILLTECLY